MTMGMDSAMLRFKGEIQYPQSTQDAQGGKARQWTLLQKAWINIRPLRGREKVAANQEYARVSHEVYLHWINGIKPDMRIVFRARVFRIIAVINVREENQILQLLVEEQVDGI